MKHVQLLSWMVSWATDFTWSMMVESVLTLGCLSSVLLPHNVCKLASLTSYYLSVTCYSLPQPPYRANHLGSGRCPTVSWGPKI